MKRFVTVVLGLALCFWSLTPAFAVIDEDDVSRLAKRLLTGKGFAEAWSISSKERQILFIKIGFGLNYLIEFRTKSCYRLFDDGVFVIDCGIIKKGYPLLAPLITW
ncbi:MAG: hypothetical protein IIC13_13805 [SAR324 cluster bacterium]|nr:hypothetical protein [SAR324 cluster bacterium]MCH8887656.1 hypothetical protein [SAR324 cluster bacterium]